MILVFEFFFSSWLQTLDWIEMIYFFLRKVLIETICNWFTFDSALGNKNAGNVFHSLECIST